MPNYVHNTSQFIMYVAIRKYEGCLESSDQFFYQFIKRDIILMILMFPKFPIKNRGLAMQVETVKNLLFFLLMPLSHRCNTATALYDEFTSDSFNESGLSLGN